MSNIIKSSLTLAISLAVVACGGGEGKSDPVVNPPAEVIPPVPSSINITETYYYATPNAQEIIIPVTKSGVESVAWTVSSDNYEWIDSTKSGTNAGEIVITLSDNNGAARSHTYTVTTAEQTFSIEIAQSPAIYRLNTNESDFPILDVEYEDFLSSLSYWNYNKGMVVTDPVRLGTESERFELRPGDCGGNDCDRSTPYERTENAEVKNRSVEGDIVWYGWSFYVPEEYEDTGTDPAGCNCINFGQFAQVPDPSNTRWDSTWILSKYYGGDYHARLLPTRAEYGYHSFKLIDKDQFAGRWHDIVVQSKWTEEEDGYTNIWVNGKLVMEYKGLTRTPNNESIFLKYGIYRRGVSPNTVIAYYDEVRKGLTREEVDIRLIENK